MTAAAAPARTRLAADIRPILACVAAGVVCGLLVGGVGGRLAMLLLRVTSSDSLRGIETDDGFTIGSLSVVGTFFFVFLAGTTGAVVGGAYGVVRPFVPVGRVAIAAAVGGLAGGSAIVHPGGIDFRFLDPLALAVALFVAIPAAGAAAIAALGDRWATSDRWGRNRALTALLFLPALPALSSPAVVATFAVLAALAVVARRRGLDRDRRVQLAVTAAVGLVGVVAGVQLASDVAEIL